MNILFEGFWRDQDKFLSSKFSEINGVMGLLNIEIIGDENISSKFILITIIIFKK